MEKRLEVEIVQHENVVVAKVLYQEEKLRNLKNSRYVDDLILAQNDDYKIISSHEPQISKNVLYIRGCESSKDKKIVVLDFYDKEKATEWCRNITSLISEINNKPCDEQNISPCIETKEW